MPKPGSTIVPLLVVIREPAAIQLLGTLERDPRVALLNAEQLTPNWISLADHLAGVIVASVDDPLNSLTYALSANIKRPIVVATQNMGGYRPRDLIALGARFVLRLPVTASQIQRLLQSLAALPGAILTAESFGLLLDPINLSAHFAGQAIRLSPREFALLGCLCRAGGNAVASEDLRILVWGDNALNQTSNNLEFYVHQVRAKLRKLGLHDVLGTVRNFGYRLRSSSKDNNPTVLVSPSRSWR